ncbi:hypothetical protein [Ancylobacter sp. TS-1]|uniref:hypothetical protein n=1 Tax=Ancylobacter sp. TS-1 TaxID=1850374 RepID=UPI001265AEE8|nr:hypothetical protein [Ancylobacter sp. TS-1]QFR33398.1 hypothetical protein GBB76_09775 [Ancylobacter sp. TS-1]
MSLKRAILLVMLGGAVVPAIGQQIELPGRGADAGNASRPKVDETALRYFASQGDTRRLEAEIARLRALYPDWTPPDDLFGPQTDVELQRMWKLYAEGKYSDVRSAIAMRQASDPSWQPPPDLVARLTEAENRRRLINASDAEQWNTVLRLATDAPGMLTCMNIDILWRVAEAFAKTDQTARAVDAYTYVLNNCNDPSERIATIQKAMPLLTDDQIQTLLKLERKDDAGNPEFAALRDDLIRRRMGHAAENPEYSVPDSDIKRMEELARKETTPGDPLLLGWYLFRHDEATRALEWFKLALDRKGGPKSAEGYVLALNFLGRSLEAEPIAYEWRNAAPENNKAYLDVVIALLTADPPPVLDEIVLSRFSPVVMRDKYVPGSQALGWYAYNTGQIVTAQSWFETALNWDPNDEPSAYGLSLTYWRLRDIARLNAMVQAWGPRSERIVALVDPVVRARLEARNAQTTSYAGLRVNPLVAAAARLTPTPTLQPPPLGAPMAGAGNARAYQQGSAAGFVPLPGASQYGQAQYQPLPQAGGVPSSALGYQSPSSLPGTTIFPAGSGLPTNASYSGQYAQAGEGDYVPTPRRRPAARSIARTGSTQVESTSSAATAAVARGWKLMDLDRPMEAVKAFDEGLSNGSGRVSEDAAYGKSLAYLRMGMTNRAQAAALQAPQNPRRAVQLSGDLLAQRALAAYKDQRYIEALIALDERSRIAPEQQDLMVLRAWCYFKIRDLRSAERIFKALELQGSTEGRNGINAIDQLTRKVRSG